MAKSLLSCNAINKMNVLSKDNNRSVSYVSTFLQEMFPLSDMTHWNKLFSLKMRTVIARYLCSLSKLPTDVIFSGKDANEK